MTLGPYRFSDRKLTPHCLNVQVIQSDYRNDIPDPDRAADQGGGLLPLWRPRLARDQRVLSLPPGDPGAQSGGDDPALLWTAYSQQKIVELLLMLDIRYSHTMNKQIESLEYLSCKLLKSFSI